MVFSKADLLVFTPNLESGGAEKVAVSICGEAVQRGRNVMLVCIESAAGSLRKSVNEEIEVVDLSSSCLFGKCIAIRRLLDGFEGDVLSCQRRTNAYVGLVAFSLGKTWRRLIFREASTFDAIKKNFVLVRIFKTSLLRIAYFPATKIIANSVDTQYDVERYLSIKFPKVAVIPNPVLPRDYKELIMRSVDDNFFSKKAKVLINIGRLEPVKGQSVLVEVLDRLVKQDESYRLVFIGSGSMEASLSSLIMKKNLQNNIKIIPFTDNVFKYLARSSLFLFSSHWEGFGNVLVESLACGTPVVGFDCRGGARDLIRESAAGRLIDERSAESMVGVVRSYFSKGAVRETAPVDEFCISAVYDRYFPG